MRKRHSKKALHLQQQYHLKPAYAAVLLACAVHTAQANPMDPSVVSGQASFASNGNTLTVTNTPGTIINWQGFSIDANEITRFNQQSASSAVLNRVVSNDPSVILGSLQSNGRVFLINPGGIVFGAGAVVDVAGLVASTLNLSDADFIAGRQHYTQVSTGANLSNAGKLNAQAGGQIFLIAANVENTGIITAPNGEILLAAGHSVDLVSTNDPSLRVNITAPAGAATNVGQLIAEAGSLGLFGTVVRNSGTVSADSAALQGGKIVFKASQSVDAGGTISAQGVGGGDIQVLADMQNGTVNVSGTLDASAPVSGNGGFIDTSAAHVQVSDGAHVTTAAASGQYGTWLIDPTDYIIASLGGDISGADLSAKLGSTSIVIQTQASGNGVGDILVKDAVTWAAPTTLTLNAINNVEINAPINSTGGSLLVRADLYGSGKGTINFGTSGSVIISSGGRADFYYNPILYTDVFTATVDAVFTDWMLVNSVERLQEMNTNLAGNYALGKDIDATATSTWNLGAGFTPVGNANANFSGQFDGLGHTIDKLTINSPGGDAGLFGVVGAAGLVRNVGLLGSVLVGGGSTVGGLVGSNAGTIINSYVSKGNVSVLGAANPGVGGLVGINSGSIINSYVTDSSVTGNYSKLGGLVGSNTGSVTNSYVSGGSVVNAATFATDAGGLVGQNSGSISNSYVSNGSVTNLFTNSEVGGLVGINSISGSISNSYTSGTSLIGGGIIGGVVGSNNYSITSAVTGNFWNTSTTTGAVFGIGSDGALGGTNVGAYGMNDADMKIMANFNTVTVANGNVNPGWVIANTGGAGAVWRIYEGDTTPLLASFLKPLTVTAIDASKVYDGLALTSPAVSYSDINAPQSGALLGTLAVGGTAQGAVNAGSYVINPTGLYSSQQGYDIGYTTGTLAIIPATLTYTANTATRLYGAANPNFSGSVTGFVASESLATATTGTASYTSQAASTSNVGSYDISGAGLTANFGNYTFVQASSNNTALSINPATLTYTANTTTRIYGTANPTFSGSVTGFVLGESVAATTGTASYTSQAASTSNVGSYDISGAGLTAKFGNYTFVQATSNNTALNITPAALSVNANLQAKIYGDADPTLSYGATGFAAGDTAAVLSGRLGRAAGENVGTYAINQGTLANTNYTITYTGNTLNITPASLTIQANSASKVLNTADPLLTYTVSGLKFTDTAANTLSGDLSRVAGERVGSYQINQGSLAVTNSNYLTTYVYMPGTFTILLPTVINEIVNISLMFSPDTGSAHSTSVEDKAKSTVVAAADTTAADGSPALPVCN